MLTKIFVFLLVLSALVVIKELYNFIRALMKPKEFTWTLARGIEFVLAFSYLVTILITGLGG